MQIFNDLTYINKSSLALGFFDGLHLGHRVVLKNTINLAKENNASSVVITFKSHPLNFLSDNKVELILTLEERLNILENIGIENVILLDFEKYSNIRAKDYLENVLIKYFSPLAITTGFNHHFGFNKEGDSCFLRKYKDIYKYKYFEVPPFVVNDTVVSCSEIRNRLHLGNFPQAGSLLGYYYFINVSVIEGEHIAAKLGFPSANFIYPEDKVKIPHGVYYVKVKIEEKEYNGVLNYGYAPTLNNNSRLKSEVHIIDFDENIYGKRIKISFIAKIRNQMKFESTDKLKAQIMRDIAFTDIYQHFLHSSISFKEKKY